MILSWRITNSALVFNAAKRFFQASSVARLMPSCSGVSDGKETRSAAVNAAADAIVQRRICLSNRSPWHFSLGVLAANLRRLFAGWPNHDTFLDHVDDVGGSEGIQKKLFVCFASCEDRGPRLLHCGIFYRGLSGFADTKG